MGQLLTERDLAGKLAWYPTVIEATMLEQASPSSAPIAGSVVQIKVWLLQLSPMVWRRVLMLIGDTLRDLHGIIQVAMGLEVDYPLRGKFAQATREFAVYIAGNTDSIINYGERFRAGERISSAFVEATVNAVISKHFAKRQQMQWTPRGAHLLLQIRTRTLDGTLRPLFESWHPGLANDNDVTSQTEAA